jgi:transketolase C-terminal domain/subunit
MAGVAAEVPKGLKPIMYSIVPFTTMEFEQMGNICYQNLNVKNVGVGRI